MPWAIRRSPAFIVVLWTLLLVGAVEIGCRFYELGRPQMRKPPLPGPLEELLQPDSALFWTLRPNSRFELRGVPHVTNSHGLRSGEIGPKGADEYRILSLGESTTWGHGVRAEHTYSALLEDLLNDASRNSGGPTFGVINAGVPAYTSFQSLKYLELRGVKLQPDMVLFYHEFNDYLPTALRDFGSDELDFSLTDWQRYDSRRQKLHRWLQQFSATYRFAIYLSARRQLDRLQGLDHGMRAEVMRDDELREMRFPIRVSDDERARVFEALHALCRDTGALLVVIHPSYDMWEHQECLITEFCQKNQVPLFNAYDSLHPAGAGAGVMFVDPLHPSKRGHRALARGIFRFLVTNRLVPLD